MPSSIFFALVAFTLSATVSAFPFEIQSQNPAFFNAGLQGCIAAQFNADGAPLVIHNCNNEDLANQNWNMSFFTRQDAGPQQIRVFDNKCIDVTGGVNADGTKLQIWACDANNRNQQWVSVTDGTLRWNGTDKCIDLTDGKITDGTQLQIWTCASNNANQEWVGTPNPDSADVVHMFGGDFSAGGGGPYCITAASDQDGAQVALAACLNSDFHMTFPNGNITWRAPVAPLTGTISTFGNKCLDVPNGNTANGVKLQLWTCAQGNTNQMFTNHNGQIQWAGTNKCLDLTDGKSVNGNPIQIWDCASPDDNPNQDWSLSLAGND